MLCSNKQFEIQHAGIAAFMLLVFSLSAGSETIASERYGFSLDMPEGFYLSDTDGTGRGYEFTHMAFPVTTTLKVYDSDQHTSAYHCLEYVFNKLNALSDISVFSWQDTQCAVGRFTMEPFSGLKQAGWAAAIPVPESGTILTVLAYSPQDTGEIYNGLILSVLDSIYTGKGSVCRPGPITAFAYPAAEKKDIILNIGKTEVRTSVGIEDAEAGSFVVNREFNILAQYLSVPELSTLIPYAFERYYRLIYRDSYSRLEKTAWDIRSALAGLTGSAANADAALITSLLSWQQGAEYKRNPSGSDFTPLPAALQGEGSDCDSRALLLAVLLNHMGYETALFVSVEKSHALLGVEADIPGFAFTSGGTTYIMCETTAQVSPGMIPQDMSDISLWMAIPFKTK